MSDVAVSEIFFSFYFAIKEKLCNVTKGSLDNATGSATTPSTKPQQNMSFNGKIKTNNLVVS